MIAVDIITDFNAAADFFSRGDFYWGVFTLFPIFAPFVVRIIFTFASLCRCFKVKKTKNRKLKIEKNSARLSLWYQELKKIPWNFPMFQPIRYFKNRVLMPNSNRERERQRETETETETETDRH